jgi:hypothetical protein
MLISGPIYELLVGMGSKTLFNFLSEGSKSIGGVIGGSKVGAGARWALARWALAKWALARGEMRVGEL